MGARRGDSSAAPALRDAGETGPSTAAGEDSLDVATRLAAELGHDLNNELAATLNYSFLLAHGIEDPELREHLDELQAAAWRASHLAQALRLFAARDRNRDQAIDVNATLGALVPLLGRVFDGVRMESHFDPRLPEVRGARTALEQVILALALHARSTLRPGGTVVFATSTHVLDAATRARVSCVRREPTDRSPSGEIHVLPGRPLLPWSTFRRALRTLHARLSHDAVSVHVDLPTQR